MRTKPRYPRISAIQLMKAKQLAESGKKNKDIIADVGIQVSYSHLCRAFKNCYGKTLSEVRGKNPPGRKSNAV